MPNNIVPLSNENEAYSKEKVGGKGYNLFEMLRLGFEVPRGFCITTDAFSNFLDNNGIIPVYGSVNNGNFEQFLKKYELLQNQILSGNLHSKMGSEILQYFRDTFPDGIVAVRSSANCEDGNRNSFAGKFDTFLGIDEQSLIPMIKKCWASLYSRRVLRYQKIKNISPELKMAIVVQEIINPDTAGVMFTTATHGDAKGKTLIEAVYGLGESLVSGEVTPDRFIVDNAGRINKDMASKSRYYTFNYNLEKVLIDTPIQMRGKFALSDTEVSKVHRVGKDLEKSLCAPQDVEWAIKKDDLYLLQTRPITA